jgi:hypothetical protein
MGGREERKMEGDREREAEEGGRQNGGSVFIISLYFTAVTSTGRRLQVSPDWHPRGQNCHS